MFSSFTGGAIAAFFFFNGPQTIQQVNKDRECESQIFYFQNPAFSPTLRQIPQFHVKKKQKKPQNIVKYHIHKITYNLYTCFKK